METTSPRLATTGQATTAQTAVLARLENVSRSADANSVAEHIAQLRAFIGDDLARVEHDLTTVERKETPLHASAHHLLSLSGKRLRPMCVALASRVSGTFTEAARVMAVAVELVHSATLLHDDVVDVGDVRRGQPSARVLYGNAASIFAGDWLLVDALRRVQESGELGLLSALVATLGEMLDGESLQLKNRGKMSGSVGDYFRVVEGKTASLFRWGLYAGGRAGGGDEVTSQALALYGKKLGVAFQVVDDLLDVVGDEATLGKSVFSDLREGKATYPLLLAVEADPRLGAAIDEALAAGTVDADLERRVTVALRETGAVEGARKLAEQLSAEAIASLDPLPAGRAKDALEHVAVTTLARRK